ncbi:zinc finger protein ZAT1-like [Salvia miltiorrhiza]|uniref:zinc finger protein ZAT1-like n=1 Tax=Salvia miltiorrhiza TaxID=226208 RepID=UPI0025AC74B0|nr:zinc finger protein ZAT1-like [Salvia miltiorrhiza]XP_057787038.1 zinc finger protein ZAT1-like [Salvia miltiorrhiza]
MGSMDCKLCFKRFSNGKALGAHMRSHYAILPLPPKPHELTDDKSATYSLRENPKKSSRLPDPDLLDVHSDSPRFKRPRGDDQEEEVTKAELEMEEGDVALCLIMLSRDVWRNNSDDSSKKIHRCEKCHKVFKSSQGLGSHKASHFKRIRNSLQEREGEGEGEGEERESVGDQVHECALCPRIFKSAQALGGHKRSHFPAPKFRRNLVDLNLPAAVGVVNEEILA